MTPSAENAGRRAEDTRRPYAGDAPLPVDDDQRRKRSPLFGIHCVAPGLSYVRVTLPRAHCEQSSPSHSLLPPLSSPSHSLLPQLCSPSHSLLPQLCSPSHSLLPQLSRRRSIAVCSQMFSPRLLSVVLCCPRSAERDRSSPQPRVIVVRRWATCSDSPMLVP